jgi:hypothetical protein
LQIVIKRYKQFFGLNAKVEFVPVMAADDLQKVLSGVSGTIQRYG